ncbi:XdhC family protein [soil metagenome]
MDNTDLDVLQTALNWRLDHHAVALVTVVNTWGSAPRPPGSVLAIRGDGAIAGSVSGGCVEDDLIARVHGGELGGPPTLVRYGVSRDEASRFGLPCGGTLEVVVEPIGEVDWLESLLASCRDHRRIARRLDMASGTITLVPVDRDARLQFDGRMLESVHGPRWRLLMIGGGQLSRQVATIAAMLDFEVLVCDPRDEYMVDWPPALGRRVMSMPDDAVLEIGTDSHTAVVCLTHDPKLDDMALLEALKSPAFYVGALGSHANTHKRRERLALFDLSPDQIDRLHGPIGLAIGSRTPAEIAVSIVAEIIAVRHAARDDGDGESAARCATSGSADASCSTAG